MSFVTIVLGTCLYAGTPMPFTEEAIPRGIDYTPNQSQPFGQGLSFADLDGDGDGDLIVLGESSGKLGLYENDGDGNFQDRFETSEIAVLLNLSGATAADYDDDGDLDLHLARWGRSNVLYRNDGGFRFTDVTAEAGVGDDGEGAGCAWGDYDLDGDLDLYVANYDGPNLLYRNDGLGHFTDVAFDLGVEATGQVTFQASFLDYDRDGDSDLYLSNSYGQHCETTDFGNILYENVGGGAFVDVTEFAGAEACVDSMCIGIGDIDGNGYLDLYATDNNQPGNALLLNQGDGTFIEDAAAAGVESFATSWGSVFFDYDHDGLLDLYVCVQSPALPNRLYRTDGDWPCEDVAVAAGVGAYSASYSVATADVDGDGDLDLALSSSLSQVRLFINHEGTQRNWVRLDVLGRTRLDAIGTGVEIVSGGQSQIREVIAGAGYKSQEELTLHYGVADAEAIDEVTITWPGGVTRTLTGLSANRRWTLYPQARLGDSDLDDDCDHDDFVRFAGCHAADTFEPGCEAMDFDGDADVDDDDFDVFLLVYSGPNGDCDGDGVDDLSAIIDGTAPDTDGDGWIDACEAARGDLDGDLTIGPADLALLLAAWGERGSPADLDGSGLVGMRDLIVMLSNWG